MISPARILIPSVLSVCSLSAPLRADTFFTDSPRPDLLENRSTGWSAAATYYGGSDYVDAGREKYSLRRHTVAGSLVQETGQLQISLLAGYEHSNYRFETSRNRHMHTLFGEVTARRMLFGDWAGSASLMAGSGAEDSANFDDGLWFGAGIATGREWDSGLSLGFGVALHGLAERGLQLNIPLTLKWRISDRVRLSLSDGLRLHYDMAGNGRTTLELAYISEYRHFRLQDFAEPAIRDLAVEELQHMALVTLHHRFRNDAFLFVSAGYTGDRELTFWRNRQAVGSASGEQTTVFRFGGGMRF